MHSPYTTKYNIYLYVNKIINTTSENKIKILNMRLGILDVIISIQYKSFFFKL